jgi:xylan 1,4-beta-xylosidase
MKLHISQDAKTYPHNKHWQFCVGSCHAALAMRTDYARQLKFIHDELGIQYVRFHGIFNDDMNTLSNFKRVMAIPGGERLTERTFHRCGLAYDNVLAAGMKPFVELGFMPELLGSEPSGEAFHGSNISLPKDFNAWAEHIQEFVKFLLHRYGREEVESWYFEVWNEPDLKDIFFRGTQQDYFKLYEVTVRAIKAVEAKLRVGGPSTSGSKWIESFVKFCRENSVPVDFVSTHQYSGDPLGGVTDTGDENNDALVEEMKSRFAQFNPFDALPENPSMLDLLRLIIPDESETRDLPSDTFPRNAAVVKKFCGDLPLFYTEWNFSASFSAYSNDTRKAASYDIKTALNTADYVDGSSVWCFSDIFEEMHQFPQEFHGGFGLQTLNGIPKPAFYGLKILARTGDERIDLGPDAANGEIGVAAFKAGNETQVLLFRQKMKQLDLPIEAVSVSVETGKKSSGVILERIDETHCNPLKQWENDGSPADLTPAQVNDYIARSRMVEEEIPYTFVEGTIQFSVSLGVNDVYFIRVLA